MCPQDVSSESGNWDVAQTVEVFRFKSRWCHSIKFLEKHVLNNGGRNNGKNSPNHVLVHAKVDSKAEHKADLDIEPVALESGYHDSVWHDESQSVPECVGVPSNKTFSEEGHQKGTRLDSDQSIITQISKTFVRNKVTSKTAELIESVEKENLPWSFVGVWTITIFCRLSTYRCHSDITRTNSSSNFIYNKVMGHYKAELDQIVHLSVLVGVVKGKEVNWDGSQREDNCMKAVLIPDNQRAFHNSMGEHVENHRWTW
jgi:hypothetical protein